MTLNLAQRAERTERTLAKFRHRPFDWQAGATCIHMARTQARNMGHRPPALPGFRSAIGARTALASTGFATLEALLDSLFARIPPAMLLVGDLAMVPGEAPFGAVMVFDGLATLLGWHETVPEFSPVVGAMDQVTGAWRL